MSCSASPHPLRPNHPQPLTTVAFINIASLSTLNHPASPQPPTLTTVALVDVVGRKPLQAGGFAVMMVLLAVLGPTFEMLRAHAKWAFIALFSLTFFAANAGPNTTVRARWYGMGGCVDTAWCWCGPGAAPRAWGEIARVVVSLEATQSMQACSELVFTNAPLANRTHLHALHTLPRPNRRT